MYRATLKKLNKSYRFWISVALGAAIAISVSAAETEYRFIVKKGDTLSLYFSMLGFNNKTLSNVLSSSNNNKDLNSLVIGQTLSIGVDKNKQFEFLSYNVKQDRWVNVDNSGNYFIANKNKKNNLKSIETKTITINSSLSYDAKKANVDPLIVDTIVRVFSWKVNFKRDLMKGDKFIIIGSNNKNPMALIFKSKSTNIALFSYKDRYGNIDYYDSSGLSVRSSFLSAPLNYKRISSKFQKSRYHPILKEWRPHRAVDYTAKKGTPVYSTADGFIKLARRNGGLGNVVYIKHGNDHLTVYAHLSKFAKGLKTNKKVKKGEVIGYVGSTGNSTGPHLHYEIRYKGERKDPLKYNIPEQRKINPIDLAVFKKRAKNILNSL